MSIPFDSNLYFYLTDPHSNLKLHHIHFSFYTLTYIINTKTYNPTTNTFFTIPPTYIPIKISKPNSTQLPHYFTTQTPHFTSLQSLINHFSNPSNNPLK